MGTCEKRDFFETVGQNAVFLNGPGRSAFNARTLAPRKVARPHRRLRPCFSGAGEILPAHGFALLGPNGNHRVGESFFGAENEVGG